MLRLETDVVERFVIATGDLMQYKARVPFDQRRVTVMFTYAPPGWIKEADLARTTADENVDVIHLEFAPGEEIDGPVNIALCEDRNGEILTWAKCDLWADEDDRLFLVVPKGQDFGFAFDGVALVRVTEGPTGAKLRKGVARARKLLRSAAWRVPVDIPRNTIELPRASAARADLN